MVGNAHPTKIALLQLVQDVRIIKNYELRIINYELRSYLLLIVFVL